MELKTKERLGRVATVLMVAVLVIMFAPVKVSAAGTFAEKDVDVRLEPHYENIAYTLDPIESLQRFDLKGDWYWPTTTTMGDSKLLLTGATNASLHVSNEANLDDGYYFETRMKPGAACNASFILKNDDAANYTKIVFAANSYVYGIYMATAGSTTTASLGGWTAATWYKVSIEFDGADMNFRLFYDSNNTVIGTKSASGQNMTYDEVDEVEFAQTVALKTVYVDYFVQTGAHTDYTVVQQTSRALRIEPEDTVTVRNIAYTLDEIPDIVTLSNDSAVQDATGYTATGIDITNDNKINETDLADIMRETPEDIDAKFTGTTVVKGWDSMRDATDESIETYLEERHDVSHVYVIDYYIDDMKYNVTVTEGMADKIEKSAIKNFMNLAEDEGAEVNYDDSVGWRSDWTDYDYTYMPRDVSAAEWTEMKQDLSTEVRKDTVSMVALTLNRPSEIADPLFNWPLVFSAVRTMDITGDLDVDTTYQETNALIGAVLEGDDYLATDAEDLDTAMTAASASGWDTIEDGKTTTSGFSLVTVFSSYITWALYVGIGAVLTLVVVFLVLRYKKAGKGKSGKKG